MSQVKNLRAMFEGKGDDGTASPSSVERGRSPAGVKPPTPSGMTARRHLYSPLLLQCSAVILLALRCFHVLRCYNAFTLR